VLKIFAPRTTEFGEDLGSHTNSGAKELRPLLIDRDVASEVLDQTSGWQSSTCLVSRRNEPADQHLIHDRLQLLHYTNLCSNRGCRSGFCVTWILLFISSLEISAPATPHDSDTFSGWVELVCAPERGGWKTKKQENPSPPPKIGPCWR
jgi:hypothetical protein